MALGKGNSFTTYGGQAVIEGVMMRGPRKLAVAVRRSDRSIVIKEDEIVPWNERRLVLRLPVVRGAVAVIEAVSLGVGALLFSANQAAESEEEELSKGEMFITTAVAVILAVFLFVLLPTWVTHFLESDGNSVRLNLLEGGVRFGVLILYMFLIGLIPDIRRVLQFHGAEHKVIHAWEAGDELTIENVRPYSTLHPRCGTSFLFLLVLVSVLFFAFTGWPNVWQRLLIRLSFFPLIAGLAYELIRFSGRVARTGTVPFWLRPLIQPGLWFQRITTREPEDDQLEVAIAAMQAAVTDVKVSEAC